MPVVPAMPVVPVVPVARRGDPSVTVTSGFPVIGADIGAVTRRVTAPRGVASVPVQATPRRAVSKPVPVPKAAVPEHYSPPTIMADFTPPPPEPVSTPKDQPDPEVAWIGIYPVRASGARSRQPSD
jgi:hypothetical protein